MGMLFKNNDFKTDYKKRPFDGYKATVDKLDVAAKKKLERQRTIGMVCIVGAAVLLIMVLYITGIGVDKTKSVSGNVFVDKEDVLIDILKDRMLGYEGRGIGVFYDQPSRRFFTSEQDLDRRYSWDKRSYTGGLPFPPRQLVDDEEEIFGTVNSNGAA